MPKGLIGLNQGLTQAREEGVSTVSTVRCNHWLRYMNWARGSYERWKLTILYTKETRRFMHSALCPQSSRAYRATEQQSSLQVTWPVLCCHVPARLQRLAAQSSVWASSHNTIILRRLIDFFFKKILKRYLKIIKTYKKYIKRKLKKL
jgi:hypothetical protein